METMRERIRRLGKERPEYLAAIRKKSYAKHAERRCAEASAWRKANPELRREQAHRYRAKKAEAAGADYTTVARVRARFLFFGDCCAYCGATEQPLEIDHVIALSRGGAHLPANIRPSCRSCNASKQASPLAKWRADR
jgi:5-methylcytosine-specific restriction endonuclease McrA